VFLKCDCWLLVGGREALDVEFVGLRELTLLVDVLLGHSITLGCLFWGAGLLRMMTGYCSFTIVDSFSAMISVFRS
jgi:hypothetical protein